MAGSGVERIKAPHSAREEGAEGISNGGEVGDGDREGPVGPQVRLSFIGFSRQAFSPVQCDRYRRIEVAFVDLDRRFGGPQTDMRRSIAFFSDL